jgi:hypothetical protein
VHENLERHGRARGELGVAHGGDFLEGVLAGEDDEVGAEFAGEVHAGRAGHGHLRGGVDREIRRQRTDEPADADVLHDGGVDAGGDDGLQVVGGRGDLVGKDQRVERDVTPHAAPVEEFHELRQVGDREVLGTHARVEALETEVDGVGAVLHGGLGAFPVAGRREQLGPHRRGARGGGGIEAGGGGHGRQTAVSAGGGSGWASLGAGVATCGAAARSSNASSTVKPKKPAET